MRSEDGGEGVSTSLSDPSGCVTGEQKEFRAEGEWVENKREKKHKGRRKNGKKLCVQVK